VIDRQARKAEVLSYAPNRLMVDTNAPEHFVLDLDEVARVKEVAGLEQHVGNAFGAEMENAMSAQDFPLGIMRRGFGHECLLDVC